jgi:iron complex outermembrane receptor protein
MRWAARGWFLFWLGLCPFNFSEITIPRLFGTEEAQIEERSSISLPQESREQVGAGDPQEVAPATTASLPKKDLPQKPEASFPEGSSGSAQALPEVTVVGEEAGSWVNPTPEKAQEELRSVPGGTNFVSAEEYRKGRSASLFDALNFQPGIYIAPTFSSGPSNNRISIRGSGLASPVYFNRGIYFLQDGIPWNEADGHAEDLGFLDLLSTQYISVYRGANALEYGSATLGGAINLVSQTGYSSPLFGVRGEAGSFGYLRGQLVEGGVEGPSDVFGSLSEFHMDGFRGHTEQNDIYLNTNVGIKVGEDVESRWYYTYMNLRIHLVGALTLEDAISDPEKPNPAYVSMDLRRFQDFHRIANQTVAKLDPDTFLETGLWWNNMWIWHPIFVFLHGSTNDFGALVRAKGSGEIFGLEHGWVVGLIPQGQFAKQVQDFMKFGSPLDGPPLSRRDQVATNIALYGQEEIFLAHDLRVVGGLQLDYALRSNESYDFKGKKSASSTRDFYGVNPKLGIIYDLEPTIQFYGNLSRSFEPPMFGDLTPNAVLLPPGQALFPLSAQRASTVEAGTRGAWERLRWDFALYHSWIDDELLLFIPNPKFPGVTQTLNASPTHHMGLESALDVCLWQGICEEPSELRQPAGYWDPREDRLILRQVYNWSDFRFDHDPVYGQNSLPIIPEHFYRAELLYTHPCGFYVGPNVAAVFGHYPVDFANTLFAPPYGIMGFRIGYQSPKHGFSVFIDARNLTDEHYISTVDPLANARGRDQQVFYPGDGRAVYAGLQFLW